MSLRAPDGTAYALAGPEGAPAVVLIHGLGLARGLWGGHLAPLAERFRVVAYDLYGHGESGPAPGEVTLALLARQATGLLDHLGIARAALVGFSIGGMINRRVALDAPERVRALAILNAPHDRGVELQAAVEARAVRVRDEGPTATLEDALARWFTAAFREARPDLMDAVRAWRRAVEPVTYAGAAWVLAHGVRELVAPEPPVAAPALVMTTGDDTGSTPAMAEAIAAEIPGAELAIVPGLRHLGLMEMPEAFAPSIKDFLERTAP